MEKGPAHYPINRVEVKTHSLAAGLTNMNWENAILGQLPTRIFLAMVDNTAFTGAYTENPFNFKHNNVNSIAVYLNGKSVPNNPIQLNFENGDFLDGYRSLFTATGKMNRDEGMAISRSEYKDGFCLFGFDLSPALCQGGHQGFIKTGNLRISLQFSNALQHAITVILYAEFDNAISVYKSREILKDY